MTKPKKEIYENMKNNYDSICEFINYYENIGQKIPGGYYSLRNEYKNAYEILKKEYDNDDEISVYYMTSKDAKNCDKETEWYGVFRAIIKSIYFYLSREKNTYLNKLFNYVIDNDIYLTNSYYASIYNDGVDIEFDEFKKLVNKLIKELKKEKETKGIKK